MVKRISGLAALMLAAGLLIVGCGTTEQAAYQPVTRGIASADFDTTVLPCQDFYQYVNGNWRARNPVPPQYGSWGLMHELYENNLKVQKQILEDVSAKSQPKGSVAQKLGDFFASAMDSAAIEAAGIEPLREDFARIEAIASLADLQTLVAGYPLEGVGVFFDAGAEQDVTNSEQVILYVGQGGLGLPDRDYYTREDSASQVLRQQYAAHVARMLALSGVDEAAAQGRAEAIMAIETRLAKASLTNVESRDPSNWYNWKTMAQVDSLTPRFSWGKYLAEIGIPQVESFSISPEKFFVEMNAILAETPLDDLKSYLRWHLVDNAAPYLSSTFVTADFEFNGTTLGGRKEQHPRWKRALGRINAYIGEGMGQLFVERTFPPESKRKAMELVTNLKTAFRNRLSNLAWMSDGTKATALAKLEAFGQKIGYPDKFRDYSALEIDRGRYLDNVRNGRRFETRRNLNKLGKPVDPGEWEMNPQEVNAYYHPLKNEIVFFAAGILQPPYFDGEADDAVNYGAIGMVIGHEMTHGFDDMGSRFDADGNMVEWWTAEDRRKFDSVTAQLVAQFNEFTVADGVPVNGQLTLGENIADLGGLTIAFEALQLARQGKADPMIDGFTQHPRFFLSFAQAWRAKQTPESSTLQVNPAEHSPDHLRVMGPLSNMAAFQAAFGCGDDSPMMRPTDQRIVIW